MNCENGWKSFSVGRVDHLVLGGFVDHKGRLSRAAIVVAGRDPASLSLRMATS